MPVESARAPSGETSPARPPSGPGATCQGCGGEIPPGRRSDAENCRGACRARGSRERHAIDPGPQLSEIIANKRRHLEATARGESTLRSFDVLARGLATLAHRHVATITQDEWRAVFTKATATMRESSRTQLARMIKAMLKGVPSWFAAVAPFTPNPPPSPPPALPRRRIAHLESLPRLERTRLAVALMRQGFLPVEIQRLTIGDSGEVLPGKPAWGRCNMPALSQTLRERLQAYANSKRLSPGTRLFPVSRAALYGVARTAGSKLGLAVSCMALSQAANKR
jgi:hypothetical protein